MPEPLEEEEVDKIMRAYEELGTYSAVAEELEYNQETVSKYVKQRKAEGDGIGSSSPDSETEGPPEGYTAEPPSNSDPGQDPLADPDFKSMSEGDFIEWFFDQSGHGVRSNFAKNLSQNCEIRGQIPDQNEFANRLMSQNSGINNDADVTMIAETYWAAAQRWLEANGRAPHQQGGQSVPGGQWVSGDDAQGSSGQSGGSWVSSDGGQPQSRAHDPQNHVAPGQSRHPAPQQPQQSTDPEVEELKEAVADLKDAQTALMRNMRQNEGKKDVASLTEKLQEMKEMQQTLEAMNGDDGQDQAVQALQQELQEMRSELARAEEAASDDGGGTISVSDDGDGMAAAALQMAAQDDVDPDTISTFLDAMGTTDPEVQKAEYEFKAEKERMRNRKELMDNFFDNLGDVSGDLVGAAMSMIQNGGDDDDGGDAAPAQQQQPPADGGQGQFGGTAPAGEPNMDYGEIQVVGDEEDGQQEGNGGVSPARERFESAEEEKFGEFRSPGDEEEG